MCDTQCILNTGLWNTQCILNTGCEILNVY